MDHDRPSITTARPLAAFDHPVPRWRARRGLAAGPRQPLRGRARRRADPGCNLGGRIVAVADRTRMPGRAGPRPDRQDRPNLAGLSRSGRRLYRWPEGPAAADGELADRWLSRLQPVLCAAI